MVLFYLFTMSKNMVLYFAQVQVELTHKISNIFFDDVKIGVH